MDPGAMGPGAMDPMGAIGSVPLYSILTLALAYTC